jgi:hypothetical protein
MPPEPQIPTALVVGHAPGFATVGLAAVAQLTGVGALVGWGLRWYSPSEFVSLGLSPAASVGVLAVALASTSTALSVLGCWIELGRQTGRREFSAAALLNLFGLSLGALELGGLGAAALLLRLLGQLR